jgi:hypothetical protein
VFFGFGQGGGVNSEAAATFEVLTAVVAPCLLAVSVIALMMEAASTCETSLNFTRLHGAITQKIAIF